MIAITLKDDYKEKYSHYDDYEEIRFCTLKEVLEIINEDRSDEWTPYNRNDWREGLEEFTEFRLATKEEIKKRGKK